MAATTSVSVFNSSTPTATQASSSFTPVANDLLVVLVAASGTSNATPTLTSSVSGQTFTLVNSALSASSANMQWLFVANVLSTAVAQTVTFNNGGVTPTGLDIFLSRVSGVTRTGTAAIRQAATQANQAANATPAVTFGGACLTANPVIASVFNAGTAPTIPSGFTAGTSLAYTSPTQRFSEYHRDSGTTTSTVTWGSTSTTAFGVTAVEIDTSAAGTSATFAATETNADTLAASATLKIAASMAATESGADVLSAHVQTVPSVALSTLNENFDAGTLNSAKWVFDNSYEGAAGSPSGSDYDITSGVAHLKATSLLSFDSDGRFRSVVTNYSAVGSSIYGKFSFSGSMANTLFLFALTPSVNNAGTDEDYFGLSLSNGDFYQVGTTGSVDQFSNGPLTYNATSHAWWRIAVSSGGSITFDTAPDASGAPGTWTTQFTGARSALSWFAASDSVRVLMQRRNIGPSNLASTAEGVVGIDGINTSISGSAIAATMAATETSTDTLAASAAVTVAAQVAATETTVDTLAASVAVKIAATLTATEAGIDTLAAIASVVITSTFTATESATPDTFASTATVKVSGTFAATESGSDTFAATETVLVSAVFTAAEAGADTFSSTAQVILTASFIATETGSDTFAASATHDRNATITLTETGADSLSGSANVFVGATLQAQESGADLLAATAAVGVAAVLAAVETGADTFSATIGSPALNAVIAAVETAQDTFVAAVSNIVTTTLAATESGSDSFSASSAVTVSVAFTVQESGNDTFAGSTTVEVAAHMAAVETGLDAFVAFATGRVLALYPLLGIKQPYTGTKQSYPGGKQSYPGVTQTYPLKGVEQDYPL